MQITQFFLQGSPTLMYFAYFPQVLLAFFISNWLISN